MCWQHLPALPFCLGYLPISTISVALSKPQTSIFVQDMELKTLQILLFLASLLLLCSSNASAYKNYTVGDSLGWFDKLEKPTINYQKWAAGKNFSLGDFLIFNTDTNHSVVQTYNSTTYERCDYDDADDDDTIQWSAEAPAVSTEAVSIAVPLLKVGMQYFFSGDYDGEQCQNGQQFKITVAHGQGLPNSLKSFLNGAPSPAPSAPGDATPDTSIPSNFNNPVVENDVKPASGSVPAAELLRGKGGLTLGLMMLCLGFFWISG